MSSRMTGTSSTRAGRIWKLATSFILILTVFNARMEANSCNVQRRTWPSTNNRDSAYRLHVKSKGRGAPQNFAYEKETHHSIRTCPPQPWRRRVLEPARFDCTSYLRSCGLFDAKRSVAGFLPA